MTVIDAAMVSASTFPSCDLNQQSVFSRVFASYSMPSFQTARYVYRPPQIRGKRLA